MLDAFPQALHVWDDYVSHTGSSLGGQSVCWLLLLVVLVPCVVVATWLLLSVLLSQLPFIILFCILLMAHLGYLHLPRASLRCPNSSFRSSGEVHTTLTLWVHVPMTLYLADRLWWLSHCKYWSVWVGLQYTFILRELYVLGLTKVPRKGIAQSCLLCWKTKWRWCPPWVGG